MRLDFQRDERLEQAREDAERLHRKALEARVRVFSSATPESERPAAREAARKAAEAAVHARDELERLRRR